MKLGNGQYVVRGPESRGFDRLTKTCGKDRFLRTN